MEENEKVLTNGFDFERPRMPTEKKKCSLNSLSSKILGEIEDFFYKFGYLIGSYPWVTILSSVVLCLSLSCGMLMWYQITDNEILWTPYGSPFLKQKEWIEKNFPKDMRYQTVIISGENVLTSEYLQYLLNIHNSVTNLTMQDEEINHSYKDLCYKYANGTCVFKSLLQLWSLEEIEDLTDAQIRDRVTQALGGSSSDPQTEIGSIVSGIRRNQTGHVIGADAFMAIWILNDNSSTIDGGGKRDQIAETWELGFVDLVLSETNGSSTLGKPQNTQIFALAERSYDDEINGAVNANFLTMFLGFGLLFIYLGFVLGRWNSLEQRVLLSLMGISVIGLALGASFGLCFFMHIFYADMHPIIPFLLLGIGVDDMFVIVQALENLSSDEKRQSVPDRIGMTMRHAGISITVTSVTDMAAFLISSTTSMPILRAFCLFAAMGVLFLYVFAVTFFVGCLALDERRQDSRKPCCCSNPKPSTWKPNAFSQREIGKVVFDKYVAHYLLKTPVKVVVLVFVFACFALGVNGIYHIKVDYDSIWYLRQSSYQTKYFKALSTHFPQNGERVEVYVGQVEYWNNLPNLLEIERVLNSSHFVRENSVDFWFNKFFTEFCDTDLGGSRTRVPHGSHTTVPHESHTTVPHESHTTVPVTTSQDFEHDFWDDDDEFAFGNEVQDTFNCAEELEFKRAFLLFLLDNQNYYQDVKFNVSLQDANQNDLWSGRFEITATRAKFQYGKLANTTVKNSAMDEIRDGLAEVVFSDSEFEHPIAYSFMYVQWEANKVIVKELIRNLSLTFTMIAVINLLLIVNIPVCIFVFVSVVFSVTNVCGFAYYMGLTIEIVTSLSLILSVGLALDYAAHIAVMYVTQRRGGRNERVRNTLVQMGTPVFNGGFSTFLAFALLGFSDSYVFLAFFKMFGCVVVFGLIHGLLFLPVMLSWFGPLVHEDGESPERRPFRIQDKSKGVQSNGVSSIYVERDEALVVHQNGVVEQNGQVDVHL